ncbi:PAAR domain-containing protein [Caballeronia sp. LZ062]|uniref:PAAR domain-containing protein n=1 Tax=unclassified Caballeronia TaxID=2646786 RepID=UPI002859DE32|nr:MULTISPECIES: PAAR domain-containing protein [unclassified Caballeronia]MDR5854834.1 PAAR domain-containing protein [Caballeronia sp. LZ050]MDR5870637.1 PAAR domain-containing protein [Caballeronia sp. LZ062]
MRDANGREAARLGDKTTHGGIVIQAAPDFKHLGVPVALDQHLTECPMCGGTFPINASGKMTHKGRRVAYIGDSTACGAVLIRT